MNRKTAKLLRTYVGQSKREGVPILLRDAKRRYIATPWTRRGPILAAMRDYINIVLYPDQHKEVRAIKPRVEQVKRPGWGHRTLWAIAQMLGLQGGRV